MVKESLSHPFIYPYSYAWYDLVVFHQASVFPLEYNKWFLCAVTFSSEDCSEIVLLMTSRFERNGTCTCSGNSSIRRHIHSAGCLIHCKDTVMLVLVTVQCPKMLDETHQFRYAVSWHSLANSFFLLRWKRMLLHRSAEPTPTCFEIRIGREGPSLHTSTSTGSTKVATTQVHLNWVMPLPFTC